MEPTIKTKYFTLHCGVRYCIALSKAATEKKGSYVGVDEAISYFFFDQPDNIERWVELLLISVNTAREIEEQEPLTVKEFMAIVDRMGLKRLGLIIVELTKTFIAVTMSEDEPKEVKKKKPSIFGKLRERSG